MKPYLLAAKYALLLGLTAVALDLGAWCFNYATFPGEDMLGVLLCVFAVMPWLLWAVGRAKNLTKKEPSK